MAQKTNKHALNEEIGRQLEQPTPLSIEDLLNIMAALRAPETGCPWDLEQTYETIVPYTLEEAYEVADAIETKDFDGLKGELGDLLFQVVYYAQIAKEDGKYEFGDICDHVSRKMIRRHPHVFGSEEVRSSTQVKGLWERVKSEEKPNSKTEGPKHLLQDVPLSLPALPRAVKLQNKAAKVGFDWPDIVPVIDKLDEEIAELKEVVAEKQQDKERIKDELGDVLFALANLARHLDIDPEQALRGSNEKMVRRFSYIEKKLHDQGREPNDATLEEMDNLWNEAKNSE